MSKIKIMCTSTGCIDYAPERYRSLDIEIIRIHVFFEGREYREGFDLNPDEFYKRLETIEDPKNNLPHTGMPDTEEILGAFDRAVADGFDEIIVFTLSSALGGTYNKISLLAKDYADKIKITVIDTKITCFGEGLLAVRAAQLAGEGADTETILAEINWLMKRQRFLGVDGRLDYLIYNGRLKGGKAFLGQMFNICPVLTFSEDGEIVPLESVRTEKKALARLCERMSEIIGDRAPEDYILFHIYTGRDFIEKLPTVEERFGIKPNHEAVVMSPVSGCHNGPWLAGYGYLPIRRSDEPLED